MIVVICVHLEDEAPVSQIGLARHGPGLFPYTLQRRHQYRHQQCDDGDHYQKLY
jgi:hypothetical protein